MCSFSAEINVEHAQVNGWMGWMGWMAHRKRKETKQQPSLLPGPAVPGHCLVFFHFLLAILSTSTVYTFNDCESDLEGGYLFDILPLCMCGVLGVGGCTSSVSP